MVNKLAMGDLMIWLPETKRERIPFAPTFKNLVNYTAQVRYISANVIRIIRNNRVAEEVRGSNCRLKAKVYLVRLPVLLKFDIFWRFSLDYQKNQVG